MIVGSKNRGGRHPRGMKWCNDCQDYKAISEFPRNKSSKDGLMVYCKPHHNARGRESRERRGGQRAYHLKGRYGITLSDLHDLIARQNGLCAICFRMIDTSHVDHDHETGKVRGVLCFNCNGGLGQFRDDPGLLVQAASYLEEHLTTPVDDEIIARFTQHRTWRTSAERLQLLFPPKRAG
jgi:recombination endonuclease VII